MIGRMTASFQWFGRKVIDEVMGDIEGRLNRAGNAWLSAATRMAPVDTGQLRASLFYLVEGRTLVVGAKAPWSGFVEFGTHKMAARPYIRPALDEIGRIFGADIHLAVFAPTEHFATVLTHGRWVVRTHRGAARRATVVVREAHRQGPPRRRIGGRRH